MSSPGRLEMLTKLKMLTKLEMLKKVENVDNVENESSFILQSSDTKMMILLAEVRFVLPV